MPYLGHLSPEEFAAKLGPDHPFSGPAITLGAKQSSTSSSKTGTPASSQMKDVAEHGGQERTVGLGGQSTQARSITRSRFRNSSTSKYFVMDERDQGGAWLVRRKRDGYALYGGEIGLVDRGRKTVCDALNSGGEFGGRYVDIETNVDLEELLVIMNSSSFEPLLNNLECLTINKIDVDPKSFKDFIAWYSAVCATSLSGPV